MATPNTQTLDNALHEKIVESNMKTIQLQELHTEVSHLQAMLNNMQSQNSQYSHDNLRQNLLELSTRLDSFEMFNNPRKTELENRKKALNHNIDITKHLLSQGVDSKSEKQRSLDALKHELETARKRKVAESNLEIEHLEMELKNLISEVILNEEHKDQRYKEMETLQAEISSKMEMRNALNEEYKAQVSETEKLNDLYAQIERELAEQQKTLSEANPLREELDTLSQSVSEYSRSKLNKQLLLQDLRDTKANKDEVLLRLQDMITQEENNILRIEESIKLEEQKSKSYQKQLETTAEPDQIHDFESTLTEFRESYLKMGEYRKRKLEEYEQSLQYLRNQKNNMEEDIKKAQEKVDANKAEFLRYSQDDITFSSFDIGDSERDQLTEELARKKSILKEIQTELKECKESTILNNDAEITQLRDRKSILELEIKDQMSLSKHYRGKLRAHGNPSVNLEEYMIMIRRTEELIPDYTPDNISDPEERLRSLKHYISENPPNVFESGNFGDGSIVLCLPNSHFYEVSGGEGLYFLSEEMSMAYSSKMKKKLPIFGQIIAIEEKLSTHNNRYEVPVGMQYYEVTIMDLEQ